MGIPSIRFKKLSRLRPQNNWTIKCPGDNFVNSSQGWQLWRCYNITVLSWMLLVITKVPQLRIVRLYTFDELSQLKRWKKRISISELLISTVYSRTHFWIQHKTIVFCFQKLCTTGIIPTKENLWRNRFVIDILEKVKIQSLFL